MTKIIIDWSAYGNCKLNQSFKQLVTVNKSCLTTGHVSLWWTLWSALRHYWNCAAVTPHCRPTNRHHSQTDTDTGTRYTGSTEQTGRCQHYTLPEIQRSKCTEKNSLWLSTHYALITCQSPADFWHLKQLIGSPADAEKPRDIVHSTLWRKHTPQCSRPTKARFLQSLRSLEISPSIFGPGNGSPMATKVDVVLVAKKT